MNQPIFPRIKAFLLFAGWTGLLHIPFRTIWDDAHQVTYFAQAILFMALSIQTFRLAEAGLVRKLHCRVVRVIHSKPVVDMMLFGRRWQLDRQFVVVTHDDREIVASRLTPSAAIGAGDHLTLYRSPFDFKNRAIDRYTLISRIAMIAITLVAGLVVTLLPHF